ncbi:MAG: type II secretion system F family protein [Patescibacteria group bacterium]
MQFSYTAIGKDGKRVTGEEQAKDQYDLGRALKERGMTLLSAKEKKTVGKMDIYLSFFSRVKMQDKIVFTKNLSAMIRAGLSLSRSLAILERQTKNAKFKIVIARVAETVERGGSLSEALAAHPNVFSSLLVAMVRAGEESGGLAESLSVVGIQMEKNYLLAKKVRGALLYPGIIITAMVIVGVLMLVFVVPTLTATFKELKVDLPRSTQAIIAVSDFLSNHSILSLLILIMVVGGVYSGLRTKKGKRGAEAVVLHLPIIGELVKKTNAARTGRTLSSLLTSGVDMVEAIRITEEVVQNSYFKDVLREAGERVQKGTALSAVFKEDRSPYPILVGEMMEVGEETGKLSDMLSQIAIFYESEVEEATKNLSTIVEPFLMVLVGVVVGFFAVSMISPTYSLLNNI